MYMIYIYNVYMCIADLCKGIYYMSYPIDIATPFLSSTSTEGGGNLLPI